MASVFTLEGPSLARVPRTMTPAFVQRQPRLLNGPSDSGGSSWSWRNRSYSCPPGYRETTMGGGSRMCVWSRHSTPPGGQKYVHPLNGASLGSESQWPQLLQGTNGLGAPRRKPKCASSGTQICREDDWGDCQCWTSTRASGVTTNYNILRGPGGLELLGLPPAVATVAGFAAAAAVGIALGTGAVWAHKKFSKKGGLSGVLGFAKPRRRRKHR